MSKFVEWNFRALALRKRAGDIEVGQGQPVADDIVAAPTYLAAHGVPANPADLARHDCIVQHGSFGGESWRFALNETVTSVEVHARLLINSAPGILAAVVAGLGIALGTRVMAGEELRTGQLVQLLDRYTLELAEVYAVFPAGRKLSAKVRAIVDHLAASLGIPAT